MRSTGFIFSLILHVTVVLAAVFWSGLGSVHVDMNQAVYKVDLVSLAAPGPARKAPAPQKAPTQPPAAEPAPQKPASQPTEVTPPKPAPAPEVPVPAQPQPKPEVKPQPRKVPPKPEAKPVADQTEKKPEPKKPEPEKKPEPKPEPKKPEPKKPEPKKPEPTPESVLANALKSVESEEEKKQRQQDQALSNELASLRKESGDIYETGTDEGSETGGGGGGLSEVFSAIVGQQIKQHWRWPDYASDSNLSCMVEITIDGQGRIMEARLARPSGKPEFDNSALRAVKETEQVAQPPAKRLQKVLINFNSQELIQ